MIGVLGQEHYQMPEGYWSSSQRAGAYSRVPMGFGRFVIVRPNLQRAAWMVDS
jgi:hypothetical protein